MKQSSGDYDFSAYHNDSPRMIHWQRRNKMFLTGLALLAVALLGVAFQEIIGNRAIKNLNLILAYAYLTLA